MRLELHGCERSKSLPSSYKAPKGEAFSPRLPLRYHDGSGDDDEDVDDLSVKEDESPTMSKIPKRSSLKLFRLPIL